MLGKRVTKRIGSRYTSGSVVLDDSILQDTLIDGRRVLQPKLINPVQSRPLCFRF